jgi:signal transduction histidine kinase
MDEYPIVEGVLDLSTIGISDYQVVGIKGEAEFYWQKLLSPHDFNIEDPPQPDGYLKIPGIWNGFEYNGEKIKGFGYATYRFKIKVKNDGWYAFRIKEFDSAYKMWANQKSVVSAGKVGTTKATSIPSWKRNELIVESLDGEIEVIIQIANFWHRKGGAEDRMYFGSADDITAYKKNQVVLSSILLGVLLMLAIYHIVLYLFRPGEMSILLFSLLCVFMALRLMSTGEKLMLDIYPNMNWFLAIRIEYISYKVALPLLLAFFYSFYKEYIAAWVMKTTVILSIIFCAVVLVTPVWFFSYTPLVYQLIVALVAVYVMVVLIRVSILREEHAFYFLVGYVLFVGILINDILYYNGLINTTFLMHMGLFILAISQAFVLSRQYAFAFYKVEDLSLQLEGYNRELEKTVEKRTLQIQQQKDEIQEQSEQLKAANRKMQELAGFKENLTEMIVHDLKSPLNIILNFSRDDRVLYAGKQMLNLVHNMLDVQRYENTKMRLNKKLLTVSKLVAYSVEQLNYIIKEKAIELEVVVDSNLKIFADEDIMNRVFVNLLSNATKFTPFSGSIKIYVDNSGGKIKICFKDSGPGIPESKKDLVFQKFGQFIANNKEIKGSTGIGLTFCKMALEAHGGSVDFESEPGNGTTFCCLLPVTEKGSFDEPGYEYNEKTKSTIDSIVLSHQEKLVLKEVVILMQQTKIYEIGKIKELITSIQPHRTKNITKWISCIKQAIFNADYQLFSKLLRMVESE